MGFPKKRRDKELTTANATVRRRLPYTEVKVVHPNDDPKALIPEFHRLRKRVFVEDMGWQVPFDEDLEIEQYDCAETVYLIAHDTKFGGVLGGARLLKTTHVSADETTSYMIRDAYFGRLPGIPATICRETPPLDDDVWELTRIISFGQTNLGPKILQAANDFLAREGARTCLFLGSPAFMRMARSMGFQARALGPIHSNEDGRYLAFSCDVFKPHPGPVH
ncbi:acyl-homoserine-lactone synthase [Roseovarius sp. CAU 1744]|uniref:acyl-homoserine-lactone synthase n=1 Tax=Roseovarius sp. CAU 1744 TaxID=3140368 RepID=UPI00325AE17F